MGNAAIGAVIAIAIVVGLLGAVLYFRERSRRHIPPTQMNALDKTPGLEELRPPQKNFPTIRR